METIWTPRLAEPDALAYDAFVLGSVAGHSSQTRAWARVASAGTRVTTYQVLVRAGPRLIGTALVSRPVVAGVRLPWAWIERGPVVGSTDDVEGVARALARAARTEGIVRLRVMPYWADDAATVAEAALRRAGFHDVQRADGAHASTLRIAIGGKPDDELLHGPARQQARWRANQATRAGATARRGTRADWDGIRAMHSSLMRRQGKRDKPASWWSALQRFASDDARGALFTCLYAGSIVGACIVLRHGPRCSYAWGASIPDRLRFSKAVLPLVEAMRWSRDVGCETFDLGGVPEEDDGDSKRKAIASFKYDFERSRVRLVREHAIWLVHRLRPTEGSWRR